MNSSISVILLLITCVVKLLFSVTYLINTINYFIYLSSKTMNTQIIIFQ